MTKGKICFIIKLPTKALAERRWIEERTAFLEEYGLTVIRIPNTEIHKNFQCVSEYIDHLIE